MKAIVVHMDNLVEIELFENEYKAERILFAHIWFYRTGCTYGGLRVFKCVQML
jgi:hypothetical protein